MAWIPGGTFLMGATGPDCWIEDGEGPVREITLPGFWMDRTCVSNREFTAFAEATSYRTDAERLGWSFVFRSQAPAARRRRGEFLSVAGLEWWLKVEGACWRKPGGSGTSLRGKMDHPAVHISWHDAAAYAAWAGKRLPTEAEWEYAARGGLVQARYPWGDQLTPDGKHRCNIWQGRFPDRDTGEDGWTGTAPAKSYPANGFGLYQMAGNVWEWCADWFSPDWHTGERPETRAAPRGPEEGSRRVIRGGSFLCHASYCNRYRVAARSSNTPDSSASHQGFRCAA